MGALSELPANVVSKEQAPQMPNWKNHNPKLAELTRSRISAYLNQEDHEGRDAFKSILGHEPSGDSHKDTKELFHARHQLRDLLKKPGISNV